MHPKNGKKDHQKHDPHEGEKDLTQQEEEEDTTKGKKKESLSCS